ncbi:MAG: hypothetical protein AAGI44_11210 [Pseudomonadota bacterium]
MSEHGFATRVCVTINSSMMQLIKRDVHDSCLKLLDILSQRITHKRNSYELLELATDDGVLHAIDGRREFLARLTACTVICTRR